MVCATPFGVNVDSQINSEKTYNNGIKASAASEVVKKTNNSDLNKNTTKTVKVVVKSIKMSKSDYKVMKSSINKYKSANGSNPDSYYWKSKALTIYKKDYIDAISRYNKFVKNNKVDPIYVNIFNSVKYVKCTESDNDDKKIKKSSNLPLAGELSGVKGLTVLQKYMNRHLNHVDGGPSTFSGVVKSKVGDCWGLAEWAAKQLKANKYKVRIVQGVNSYVSNHRWVQVRLNGKWLNFESSLVTKKYGSKNYSKTCARLNKIVKTL
ncbi:MAG: transglutaminase domain-containing protein [Methanobrevibacter arboriphilus]|jgi:hypothetical protein|uniref:Uncharacterized protein n=3 Tax=Methanobrevibacter arboriphilus TaxID=39441 RepID=A0ACA8R5S7_METAZ|nr:transglutaminase domain-containing protein [Methanobrevibacter arboriphilus]MBF4468479.1 transglutaminase domain-containing protein [Methanobrevibacter arboriphilus]MCC7562748.1 transglutaminase domain-containing protein [Methanobrevibacter arboriphilus]BBL62672.1 hypothetical protein MarbSA_17120 [Methanobrevibacter arboriphilus]GLI11911.1 hypothetical protein MARBORIA2_10010 [Methanobrevibacter arboriphilus]